MKKEKICQSCGFPLKRDTQGGGTEADGSISPQYCSMCYKDGEFLSPSYVTDAKSMQRYCIQQMRDDGINPIFAFIATRTIPGLARWKKK